MLGRSLPFRRRNGWKFGIRKQKSVDCIQIYTEKSSKSPSEKGTLIIEPDLSVT